MPLTHRQLEIVRRSTDEIVAMPGGEITREQVASLLIAGIMAHNQYEVQGRFNLEGCRKSLEAGDWSHWRASVIADGLASAFYPSVEAMLKARRRRYGWRAKLRNAAFRVLVMTGARVESPPARRA